MPVVSSHKRRRQFLKSTASAVTLAGLAGCSGGSGGGNDSLTIGVLTALSGPFSLTGQNLGRGAEVAAERVNEEGDVLGEEVELLTRDTESSAETGGEVARELVQQENVDALVGPVGSGVLQAVLSVAEGEVPLLHPLAYPGHLCGEHFFAPGAVPNQNTVQTLVPYLFEEFGDSWYAVGSDYAFGQIYVRAAVDRAEEMGATVEGQDFAPPGTSQWGSVVSRIQGAEPDVIWSAVVGADGAALLSELQRRGVSENVAIGNPAGHEAMMLGAGPEAAMGTFHSADYLASIDNDLNREFKERYLGDGEERPIFQVPWNAHFSVLLLAEATREAGTTEFDALLTALKDVRLENTAQGAFSFDADNNHAVQNIRFGRVTEDSFPSFEIVGTQEQIDPNPQDCQL